MVGSVSGSAWALEPEPAFAEIASTYRLGQAVQVDVGKGTVSWSAAMVKKLRSSAINVELADGKSVDVAIPAVRKKMKPYFAVGEMVQANSVSRGGWTIAKVVKAPVGGATKLEYGPDSKGEGAVKVVDVADLDASVQPWYSLGQLVKLHFRCSLRVGFLPGVVTHVSDDGTVTVRHTASGETKSITPKRAQSWMSPYLSPGETVEVWSASHSRWMEATVSEISKTGTVKVAFGSNSGTLCEKIVGLDEHLELLRSQATKAAPKEGGEAGDFISWWPVLDELPQVPWMVERRVRFKLDPETEAMLKKKRVPAKTAKPRASCLRCTGTSTCNCRMCTATQGNQTHPILALMNLQIEWPTWRAASLLDDFGKAQRSPQDNSMW
mmetsp:Transcript_32447/g.74147  ORF Transcript_32447/g.74147 Transcript_32447/m.74147 type:complete len:381 (+) Transcript_32447:65-1207(+)